MVKIKASFWKDKKVLVTGHTGFKGSWLVKLLLINNAKVYGISLKPKSNKNLYNTLKLNQKIDERFFNILDKKKIENYFKIVNPDIVFHLAAQPLVIESIQNPELTFNTNIMGTFNILNSFKNNKNSKVCIIVTSDKCYDNNNKSKRFNENSKLGGDDPYSSSKACAELIVDSYRKTFIDNKLYKKISTVRAGNVIGGGDWGDYRILPNLINNIFENEKVIIRNKKSTRPWQHVLDCLHGYTLLAEKMYQFNKFNSAWNFGPIYKKKITVEKLINDALSYYNLKTNNKIKYGSNSHNEKNTLYLNSNKSFTKLKWKPKFNYTKSLKQTLDWYKAFYDKKDMNEFTNQQIKEYLKI
ncbi:CDP-glucose 4,6-dehydratase [Alphaproteobacteria bacterium]|nr:CDP-glucose 4,6-dehydratase [Alphaproteobacteria bacterium]